MSEYIYFFIYYTRVQKEDEDNSYFISPEDENKQPKCILTDFTYDTANNVHYYYKIFKVPRTSAKGKKFHCVFEFEIGDDIYIITFDANKNTFIYDVELIFGRKILDIRRKIPQNKVEYRDKIDYFIKALNGEKEKLNELYKNTLELYSKKKGFSFLIPFFLKIYNEDGFEKLCENLLGLFREMNGKEKDNEKNMDRKAYLKDYKDDFSQICEQSFDSTNYKTIDFYGLILCYLNFYDYDNFLILFEKLFSEKKQDLFDILLIYHTHFKYPIPQDLNFFYEFIEYIISKKEFNHFQIGINYIKNIETFINVIYKNLDKIYEKFVKENISDFEKYNIIVDKNLTLNDVSKSENNFILKKENNEISKRTYKSKTEIPDYLKKIQKIVDYCNGKEIVLLYFKNDFWKYILDCYKEPKQVNILICDNLRKIFIEYYKLVDKVIKDDKFTIKREAKSYMDIDRFAFLLDENIKKYIDKNNDLGDIEKLDYISKFNPYYNDPKYSNKVNSDIFDSFDLTDISKEFIEDFKKMEFEKKFKNKIDEYITKIISKIKNIFNFIEITKLININTIEQKAIILEPLNKKYDYIIKQDIDELSGTNSGRAIKIIADFAIFNYKYEANEKKYNFIEKKVKELPKNIIPKIFIEIVKIFFEEKKTLDDDENEDLNLENKVEDKNKPDLKELIDNIFEEYIKKLDDENDINNIIELLDCFKEKNDKKNQEDKDSDKDKELNKDEIQNKKYEVIINEFLEKLINKHLFKKEDFFSSKQNIKISLLYKLYENGKIKENDCDYYDKIQKLLNEIKKDLDGNINKKKLDDFMDNEESFIIKRLSLINIIFGNYRPEKQYEELKRRRDTINQNIKNLSFVKENIILYFKEKYKDIMKDLSKIIKDNENIKINDYNGDKINRLKNDIKGLEQRAAEINENKNFLLFNIIYDMNSVNDEENRFIQTMTDLKNFGSLLNNKDGINKLYFSENEKYKKIIEKIQDKLIDNEDKAKNFIEQFTEKFAIKDKDLIKELTILFKCKKYELDIKGIKFFFDNFDNNNEDWNKKLTIKNNKNFNDIKKELDELEKNDIYHYLNIQDYNRIFSCLYDKKEAMEFLFEKIGKNINYLKDRIQPSITTLEIKDIVDTQKCIKEITDMKKMKDNFERFAYIKRLDSKSKTISQFENYSKIYRSVINLDRYYDKSENIYEQVEKLIKICLTLKIKKDSENFFYIIKDDKNDKIETTDLEKLIHLKNKITIKDENKNKNETETNDKDKIISSNDESETNANLLENENDKIKKKRQQLLNFKNVILNLEIIMEYMKDLRTKGSSLPIEINIQIKDMNKISYDLNDKLDNFNDIKNFLLNAKNNYNSLLEEKYQHKFNLRFLYGKQFKSFMNHLEGNEPNIDSFLRYILNITDNNVKIEEGDMSVERKVEDFINHYKIYDEDSLDNISEYITSLFLNNHISLDEHFEQMKIWSKDNRGIYLYEHNCENSSMEQFIINLFWDKIRQLPIAQNILIANKETSDEEIQAFFYRSILCSYNTLFVVEITESFSEYQQTVMNNQIDQVLTYKIEECTKGNNKNFEKRETENYLDSCIVFIYDKKNKNNTSFLKEIKKLNVQTVEISKNFTNIDINMLGNIQVITSDICGLGKSGLIKKKILDSENKKDYLHFPLGGILTKKIIFDKLKNLLNKIKENKYKYENVAIHLDLTESEEKSILNEFFFSFLVTKFYTINKDIIYIPKDISIYIEIPNCFEDYLSKFNVLKIFNHENISVERMEPFNYKDDILKKFDKLLGINTNEKLEQFLKDNIIIKKYSYHQINIFIKLFISQFDKIATKLYFTKSGEDITDECIRDFANSTLYFTNGGFSKLLTRTIETKATKALDKLSEVYSNDINEMEFTSPLIFIFEQNNVLKKFFVPTRDEKAYSHSKDFLKKFKDIIYISNEIDKDVGDNKSLLSILDNYVITNDNFRKMILLYYRIKANIPVIIMGDTGCGKTALIKKLNQLLNNGKETVITININPGVTDESLSKIMEENDKIASEKKNEEVWFFFDEINTCLSLSLITEIFINRTYNGNKINDNIRLIGACNPYRKRIRNKEKCGLSLKEDNENELVYLVNPLPQSLLYYVFSFGSLDDKDEKKYIYSIIETSFSKDEKKLHELTTEAISKCHIYLREKFDPSVVSLREIARFNAFIQFFINYFSTKNKFLNIGNNEKNNKLRSIICTIYLCYYIRLTEKGIRHTFEIQLRPFLLKLINKVESEEKKGSLMEQILDEDLKKEIKIRNEKIDNFSDFIKIEQDFLIEQIKDINKGIGKNSMLKENVFLLFSCIVTNIPLIIIGKPGSGKSLSAQIIKNSVNGVYSKNKFFTLYKNLIQTYFQGSETTLPEDVENLFEKAEHKLEYFYENKLKPPISMPLFDELGLAEISKANPLKILHTKLEYDGKVENVSFVGISNYTLDAAKINRALVLAVPDLDQRLDQLTDTARNIVESISPKIKNDKIFEILSQTYFYYKENLQLIKKLMVLKTYLIDYNKKLKQKKNSKDANDKKIDTNKENENLNEIKVETIKYDQNENQTVLALKNDLSDPKLKHDNTETDENNANAIKEINRSITNVSEDTFNEQKNKASKEEEEIVDVKDNLNFDFIEKSKDYNDMMKKDERIKKDFHGNRDFYYLIKGIAYDIGDSADYSDNEKFTKIIIKHIERNFGGIEYDIDINFNLKLEGIKEKVEKVKKILEEYEGYHENKPMKVPSVYIFKKLYNLYCDELDPNGSLKIKDSKINDYNLNACINDNINDKNSSRFILLEVKKSLTTLICQKIRAQHEYLKPIQIYDGSPFIDDINKAYRFDKIKEIMGDAGTDKLIIIENLNQIHAFLYDLYNMNYEIINDKKYARVCLDSNNDQPTLVNDKFRIIILEDKNYVKTCNLALLNRLEKMNLNFGKLLDNKLKTISENIIDDLYLKNSVNDYSDANYSLKDLLINCNDEELEGLIYYLSRGSQKDSEGEDNEELKEENINEEQLKDDVAEKLYKILPQDIIAILSNENILKKKYFEKKDIYNFEEYKNYLFKEENSNYKISIIYTYTSIAGKINGLNNETSFMISEIRSEKALKYLIDELKSKKNILDNDRNYISIHFKQSNSQHIKYLCNFIGVNYLENNDKDNFKFIIILHINRNLNINKREKINSIPDINPIINQMFIDDLNGNRDITLRDLSTKDIQTILNEKKKELKLYEEFDKTLINFVKKYFEKKEKLSEYQNEIQEYMKEEDMMKEKIIETTYKLIDENKDKDEDCSDLIGQIYKNNLVNKYTLDIVSCLNDFIKENIFDKYLLKVLKILEDNNCLTTLLEVKNKKSLDKQIVNKIITKILGNIKLNKNKKNCKFLYNYNIPGFYNFIVQLSEYINKNIISNYSNIETKVRKLKKEDFNLIRELHETEEEILNIVINEFEQNQKFIFDIMKEIKEIPDTLILKDYITYYLQKYKNPEGIFSKDDIYHEIIELLINLRFNKENEIIKSGDRIKILFMKIIWIESNINYILNIIKVIDAAKAIFRGDEKELFNSIKELEYRETKGKSKIKYITNENKNHECTKEVSECYYILLASICYCITDEINIDLDHYCSNLKEINDILQNLNEDLNIFLNEMYIVDELIKIIEIFQYKNIDRINEIKNYLRKNAIDIQKYSNKNTNKLYDELGKNFEENYKLINNEEDNEEFVQKNYLYYDKLRYILFQEIKRIPDPDYQYKILEKLIEEKDIVKKSIDIFQIVFKNCLKKEKFENNLSLISFSTDNIIQLIDKKLYDDDKVLEETLLYLFEKNSYFYFNNMIDNNIKLEDQPFEVFKQCIDFLDCYINLPKKIEQSLKQLTKLFSLGYIKTFCYEYIQLFENNYQWENLDKVIGAFNGEKIIHKMIRLYLFKIFYNKYSIYFFYDQKNIDKFHLDKYNNFKEFNQIKELSNISKIDKVQTLENKYYDKSVKIIEKYKNLEFNEKIKKEDYKLDEYGVDNFYIASFNYTLLNLSNFDNNLNYENNKKFYDKICYNLFYNRKIIKICYRIIL